MPSTAQEDPGDHRRRHRSARRARAPLRRAVRRHAPASATRARSACCASNPPAAIVLDLDLATFDAFELLRLIDRRPRAARHRRVVVLAPTATSPPSSSAHRLGAAEFVTKPFSPDELGAKLDDLVSGRTQRAAGRLKLGALLVASGLVTQEQLDGALERQRRRRRPPRRGPGRRGPRERAGHRHRGRRPDAHRRRRPHADRRPRPDAIGLLPRDFIVRHRLMPLSLDDNGSLVLAMTNPLDVISIDEVGMRTKKRVVPVICTESGVRRRDLHLLQLARQAQGRARGRREEPATAPPTSTPTSSRSSTACSPTPPAWTPRTSTSSRARTLSTCAAASTACCTTCASSPRSCRPASSAASRSWATSTSPSGACRRTGARRSSSPAARPSTCASPPSPACTARTSRSASSRSRRCRPRSPRSASSATTSTRFEAALKAPEGGIVIVGPTGSGKSTTLYTTLELIKTPERKVYTVEDPIERKIDGIIQTEVKPTIGLTFAQALRSLVRADPDVIMVGEIRDLETAKMAADSAVTGHQVFSTLHTNDASSAVNRLVEMGVPRYLVAAAWRCFVAQRLVRRLCPHCRKRDDHDRRALDGARPGRGAQEAHQGLQAGRLHQVLRHRLSRPRRPLRGARRRRRPARPHRHRRHGPRDPAPGARQGRRLAARRRHRARSSTGSTSYLELLRVTV